MFLLEVALRWTSMLAMPMLALGLLWVPWSLDNRALALAVVVVGSALLDLVAPRVLPAAPAATRLRMRALDAPVWCAVPAVWATVAIGAAHIAAAAPDWPEILAAILVFGITTGTVGVSAAHELIHRRSRLEQAAGTALSLLAFYPHFPVVHLQVHHAVVGTERDPGTARLNETLAAFLRRAVPLAWSGAWQAERRLLARRLLHPWSWAWSWRNRVLRNSALLLALLAGTAAGLGAAASVFIAGQGIVAVLLTMVVDYTQHYGLAREAVAPGRLEPVRAGHSWTTDHASNRLTFNLGLHAAHHLEPARRGIALDETPGSPRAPVGYPGLVLLALVPPLWFRVMNGRFAEAGRAAAAGELP